MNDADIMIIVIIIIIVTISSSFLFLNTRTNSRRDDEYRPSFACEKPVKVTYMSGTPRCG